MGGFRMGNVGGNVNFSALGDIVGGNKITTITTTIQISVQAVTQRPLNTASPYRGLDPFQDRDKDLFFGRDQLINSLVAQLSESNVLLVLGASGSGKSSLVRAGLLPQLSQLIGVRFRYFTFVPDVDPFESLRGALLGVGFNQTQTRELLEANPATPARLIHTLRREGEQWLLFVDQLEEIFTVCGEAPRKTFIAALLAIAQDSDNSAKLVLAMRADFLDRLSPFPEFAKIVQKEINLVADMHVDELRLAIEQPAARHGVVFEQGLVEEIVKDVQGQAGSLPLLQYTLDLLWQEEASVDQLAHRHLNTCTYRKLGGVRGALQKRADEIYTSFGDGGEAKSATQQQKIVREIFLGLVDLAGEGSNVAAWRPVRRRTPMAMFSTLREQEILRALVDQKLLVSNREGNDATVEVAHEALFASWQRLKNWIEASKHVIFVKNRLAVDARQWQRRQQEGAGADEDLLAGSRLSQALELRARGDFTVVGGLGETETRFLDASVTLRDRRAQEEQARQQRELEAAKRLAEVRTLAAIRLRRGLVAAVILMLAAIGIAFYAYEESEKAKRNSVQADFDLAMVYRTKSEAVDPQVLTHLARALKTDPNASLPRQYLKSLLLNHKWCFQIDTLRHENWVMAASFSPDGRRIVNASEDNTARVWDAETGKPLGDPLRHDDKVVAATFSPDGRLIVTASEDKTARVWNAETGRLLGEPLRHQRPVVAASFSPDGRRIVTASEDKTARVWDAETGKPLGDPLRHDDVVTAATFSPDGRRIVTASYDKTARVWDAETGGQLTLPSHHQDIVVAASFSPDGGRIITASCDNTAQIWDAETGQPLGEPLRHDKNVVAAHFSPDGSRIVTASFDNTARVWDAETGETLGESLHHDDKVVAASFSPDGRRILTASEDNTARVWDAETDKPLGEPLRHDDKVAAASFSPDGRRIITASRDKTARVWDAETGKPLGEPLRHQGRVLVASFSPDGRRIVTASWDNTARVWDAETGKPLGEPLRHEYSVVAASLSPDGRRILTASVATAHIWDAITGKPLGEPLRHQNFVLAASFSPDGRRIVTASWDNTARVWDAETGKPLGEPLRHENWVLAASFSPDGRRIVTASEDNTARVWDAETGKPLGEPLRHQGPVLAASFSPDGRRIVTGSLDATAQIWDAKTGNPMSDPVRHQGPVVAASFSPDGRRIVTASEDNTARVWEAETGLAAPLPYWVPELAEMLAGQKINENGQLVPMTNSIPKLRNELLNNKSDDYWSRFGRWFFTRGPNRTVSPDSKITVGQMERYQTEK